MIRRREKQTLLKDNSLLWGLDFWWNPPQVPQNVRTRRCHRDQHWSAQTCRSHEACKGFTGPWLASSTHSRKTNFPKLNVSLFQKNFLVILHKTPPWFCWVYSSFSSMLSVWRETPPILLQVLEKRSMESWGAEVQLTLQHGSRCLREVPL